MNSCRTHIKMVFYSKNKLQVKRGKGVKQLSDKPDCAIIEIKIRAQTFITELSTLTFVYSQTLIHISKKKQTKKTTINTRRKKLLTISSPFPKQPIAIDNDTNTFNQFSRRLSSIYPKKQNKNIHTRRGKKKTNLCLADFPSSR